MLKQVPKPEEEFDRTTAVIQSMTRRERERPELIDGSRRRRVARGSGTQPADVSQVVKSFTIARDMMKKNNAMSMLSQLGGMRGASPSDVDLAQLMTGNKPGAPGSAQPRGSRLTPEQKRRLRQKRLRHR